MTAILIEGVLFVALLVTVAALFFMLLTRFTPLGRWMAQSANRRKIDREAELRCPIHGPQGEESLVRLSDGSRLCPHCYKEEVHGDVAG